MKFHKNQQFVSKENSKIFIRLSFLQQLFFNSNGVKIDWQRTRNGKWNKVKEIRSDIWKQASFETMKNT